jgi:Lon protease-like protein
MEHLPSILPVFRVRSTILMPHAQLPITMCEKDYLEIAAESIENNIVAVVQPKPIFCKKDRALDIGGSFKCGCAGRITDIHFADDEVAISIFGLCRFDIENEEPKMNGMDRVLVNYDRYKIDMEEKIEEFEFDKNRLMNALDIYFKNLEIFPNWKEIEKTPPNVLISALAIACPFHPSEKQSILETVNIAERSNIITQIIEMNSFDRYNTASTVN